MYKKCLSITYSFTNQPTFPPINLITIAVINLHGIVIETCVPRATDSREESFLFAFNEKFHGYERLSYVKKIHITIFFII